MLRRQISEGAAAYGDPVQGVNLHDGDENLRDGEARLMENCEYYGGLRIRRGSQRITPTALSAAKVTGGHRFYFGGTNPQALRLISYGSRVSSVNDVGTETILTSTMTSDRDVYFATWSITDSCYISNKVNALRKHDGLNLVAVSGNNIPVARTAVVPILDRLMCITTNGIERTNPRVDNVWSNNSSWATLRPQQPGLFTALHPHTMRGTDTLYPGALAFQERAYYLITGTNFGDDVLDGLASEGEDAAIRLLDPTVGTASPYSVCSVPGIGVFFYTTDNNVFWIPEGSLTGKYVGDKIQSTVSTAGIESTNAAQLSQVWMAYYDHILMLGVPMGSNTYASTQFWMDMRALRQDRVVWYGPMTGQTVGRVWVENQNGDNRIMGGEGNAENGTHVYQLRVPGRFTDAVGATDSAVSMVYQTPFKSFGTPSREKYVQAVHLDLNSFSGTATLDLLDLDGTLASDLPIEEVSN